MGQYVHDDFSSFMTIASVSYTQPLRTPSLAWRWVHGEKVVDKERVIHRAADYRGFKVNCTTADGEPDAIYARLARSLQCLNSMRSTCCT
jgi:hypothetical protein